MEKIYNDKVKFNSVKLPQTKFKKGPLGIEEGIQWDNGDEISEIHPFINAVDIDWNEAQVGDGVVLKTTGDLLDYIQSNGFSGLITNSTIANVAKTLICDEAFINTLWSKNITTDYLTVNKAAHFFELVIDQMRSIAGTQIITAANCIADYVEFNSITHQYRVYWRNTDPNTGKSINNNWEINDQAFCQTFNVTEGQSQNIGNSYYWRLVTNTSNNGGIRYVNLNTGEVSLNETKPDFRIVFSEYDSNVQLNVLDNTWTPKDSFEQATFSNFTGQTQFSFKTNVFTKLTIKTYLEDGSIQYSEGDSYKKIYSIEAEQPIVKIDINAYVDKWEPCNWIDLSDIRTENQIEKDENSTVPTAGDNICQLGYRYTELEEYINAGNKEDWKINNKDKVARASAIIIASYATPDNKAVEIEQRIIEPIIPPSYAQYHGIIDFTLAPYRKTYFDATGAHIVGKLEAGSAIDQEADVSINVETWRILANSTVITKGTNNTYKPNSLKLSILYNNGDSSDILTTFGGLHGKQIWINDVLLSGQNNEDIEFNNYFPDSDLNGDELIEAEENAEVTIVLRDPSKNNKILDKLVIPIIKINVTNGTDGTNGVGTGVQFIYKYDITQPNTPSPSVASTPSGWQVNPTPPENLSEHPNMVCWMSQRIITYNGSSPTTYGNWSEPIQISGKNGIGEDGGDIEFIYYLTNDYTGEDNNTPPLLQNLNQITAPSLPANTTLNNNFITEWQDTNSVHIQSEPDYLPPSMLDTVTTTWSTNWTDNPTGVDYNHQYEWVSVRYKKPGETWGEFTTPSLWAKYGVNGTKVEYIYQQFTDPQTWSNPAGNGNITPEMRLNSTYYDNPRYWPIKDFEDDYLGPEGFAWTDNPQGVTPEIPFEYVSQRIYDGHSWTEFTEPVIWSHWGSNGEDGDGVEYIFKHFEEEVDWSQIDDDRNPANWEISNSPGEYLGPIIDNIDYRWNDNPQGVGSFIDELTNEEKIFKYEYVSIRKYLNGEWRAYSEPVLWTRLGQDGGRYYMLYQNAQEKPTIEDRTTTPRTIAYMQQNQWKTVNELESPDFTNGYYTYMTQTFLDTPDAAGIWSDPLRITGATGAQGADGEDGVNGKLWKLSPLKTDFLVKINNNLVNYDEIVGSLYVNLEFGILYIDGDTSQYVSDLTNYRIKLITDNTVGNNGLLVNPNQLGNFIINSITYNSLTYQHNNYLQQTSGLEPGDENYYNYTNYYYLHQNPDLLDRMPTQMTVILYKNDEQVDTYTIPLVFKPDNLFSVTEAALNSIYQGFSGEPVTGTYTSGFSKIGQNWQEINLQVGNQEKFANGDFPEDTNLREYVYFRKDTERTPDIPNVVTQSSRDVNDQWTRGHVSPNSHYKYVFYTWRTKDLNTGQWKSWNNVRLFKVHGIDTGFVNAAELSVKADAITSTVTAAASHNLQTFKSEIIQRADSIEHNVQEISGNVENLSEIIQRSDGISFNISKILSGEFPVDTDSEQYVFLLSTKDITTTLLQPNDSSFNFVNSIGICICEDNENCEECNGINKWTTNRTLEPDATYKYLWYSRRTIKTKEPEEEWNDWEYPVLFWEYGKQRGIVQNNHNFLLASDGIYQTITDTNDRITSFSSTIEGLQSTTAARFKNIETLLENIDLNGIPSLPSIVSSLTANNEFISNIVTNNSFKNTLGGFVHDNSIEFFGEYDDKIAEIRGNLSNMAGSFQSLQEYETWINGQKEVVSSLISNIPDNISLTVTKAVNDKFTETGIDIRDGNINLVADKTTFGTSVKGEGDNIIPSTPMIAIQMCNEDNEVDANGTIPSIVFYSGEVNNSTPIFILNYLGLNQAINNAVPQTWTTYSIKPAILIEEDKYIIHAEALISSNNNPPIADEDRRYGWGEHYEDTPYTNIYKYNAAFYTDGNGNKVFSLTAGANLDQSFWEKTDLNAARLPNTNSNNKLEGYFVMKLPTSDIPEDFPIPSQPRGRRQSPSLSESDVNILIQQGLISTEAASIGNYTQEGNYMVNTTNSGNEPIRNDDYTISSGTHSNTGNSGISNVFSSIWHLDNYLLFKVEDGSITQYTEFTVEFWTLKSADGTQVFLDTIDGETRRSKIIINTPNGSREGLWMNAEYMLDPLKFEQDD